MLTKVEPKLVPNPIYSLRKGGGGGGVQKVEFLIFLRDIPKPIINAYNWMNQYILYT